MADPLTSTLRLTEPTIGGDTGLWAGYLNNNMIFTDQGVNQTISVSIPDTNVTLVADGTTSDQARYYAYNFTGALTANRTVTLPNVQRQGWAANNTTGGFNVILSAGGTTYSLPPDGVQRLYASDGSTNVTSPSVGFSNVWQKISQAVVVAGTQQTFALPSVFQRFRLITEGVTISIISNNLAIQFSNNGGVSYITTGYSWADWVNDSATNTAATGSSSDNGIPLSSTLLNSAAIPFDSTSEIWPGSVSLRPTVRTHSVGASSISNLAQYTVSGASGTTALMDHIKIFIGAGTFSGTLILEALP